MGFRAAIGGTNSGATANTATCTATFVGASVGDAAVVWFETNSGTDTVTTPAGWDLIAGPYTQSANTRGYLFGKKALTSGDIASGQAFTYSSTGRLIAAGVVLDHSVASWGTPQEVQAAASSATQPSVTTVGALSDVVAVCGNRLATASSHATTTFGGVWTKRQDVGTNYGTSPNMAAAIATLTTPLSAGGSTTAQTTSTSPSAAQVILITVEALSPTAFTGALGTAGEGTATFAGAPSTAGALATSGAGTASFTGAPGTAGGLGTSGAGTATFSGGTPAITGATLATSGAGTSTFTPGVMTTSGTLATSGAGTATFVASGIAVSGSLATSGAGTASFGPVVGVSGSLATSGAGTATFAGSPSTAGGLATSGAGTSTFAGAPGFAGGLATGGTGTSSFTGGQAVAGTLATSGAGAVSFAGIPALTAGLATSGSGTSTFVGAPAVRGVLATGGTGTVSFAGTPAYAGVLATSGSGTSTFGPAVVATTGHLVTSGEGTSTFHGAAQRVISIRAGRVPDRWVSAAGPAGRWMMGVVADRWRTEFLEEL